MTHSQAYEAGKLAQWEAEHLVPGDVPLAQLNQDTRDSIRGANNYQPNSIQINPEGYWPSHNPNDLPDLSGWQDRELELD
jgi:hypothetical protein